MQSVIHLYHVLLPGPITLRRKGIGESTHRLLDLNVVGGVNRHDLGGLGGLFHDLFAGHSVADWALVSNGEGRKLI